MIGKLVKARKVYYCNYCGKEINIGEKYFSVGITPWDHPENDGFETWHIHEGCKN